MSIGEAKKAELAARNQSIVDAYLSGKLQREIAGDYGITRSMVSHILGQNGARLPPSEATKRCTAHHSPQARKKAAVAREKPLKERFYTKIKMVLAEGDCWEWLGSTSTSGYAQLRWRGKTRFASHVSLTLFGRPRPDGMCALHTCDNPICVNPNHLWWGTQKDNVDDCIAKGRHDHSGLAIGQRKGAAE